MNRFTKRHVRARVLTIAVALAFTVTLPLPQQAFAADPIETIATSYQPTIHETIDASGFRHPAVGITKEVLENVRAQVRARQEPWNTHFNSMLLSAAASRTVTSSNQGADPTKPNGVAFNSQGFNSRFIADGLKAYTQALLYYITGDDVYRANALKIIRIWEQMDPNQYAYFNDSHIHTGIPLSRMVAAAEILRYTSTRTPALEWTEQDTLDFTNNLIVPVTETFNHTNSRFMNQHLYPLLGAMSGYIFTGNRARYEEGVEWFTVNRTAVDQGQNGSIKQLFRLVEKNDLTGEAVTPRVQHVEMGRDQAHGAGDITNASILARLLMSQGTKVDPVDGTASTAPNAVGPYEFLDDRILAATEYFSGFMLGNEMPWTPTAAHTDENGHPTIIYQYLADGYRGRSTQNSWEVFHYYKYVRGIDIEQLAPYTTKFYADRIMYNWDGVDGGGDYWLFIPAAAAQGEGGRYLVKPVIEPLRELEDRFTSLDGSAVAAQDATGRFVRIDTTGAGSRLAIYSYAHASKNLAFRVRTNDIATLEAFGNTVALPDTKGQWRYVNFALDATQGLGDMLFITVNGAGTRVDLDHINVQGAAITPPVFNNGSADLDVVSYAGSTAPISRSFAATDPGAGDTVSYQVDHLPAGASFNPSTGAFSWQPAQPGTYSFVVTATDGTAVTTKTVRIVVTADRQSAIAAIAAAYKPGVAYVAATRTAYEAAHAQALAALSGTSDADFAQKLAVLEAAATALSELTPLLADGTINYRNLFVASTIGNAVPLLLDGTPYSWSTAPTTLAPNLAHTMDFGPDFKVSASEFRLQVRVSFPERIGGAAFFGSNDNENWTQLTGLTEVTEEMQTLPVQDDLKDKRFRFLKVQMVQPTYSIFEIGEMRIAGTRHETVNLLSAVSIDAEQALKKRIVAGNTVRLSFRAKEPINNVNVLVQGQAATLATTDNLNWTATWVANATAATGPVKFEIRYKTPAGADADAAQFTTDGSSLFIADLTGFIALPQNVAALSDSSGRNQADVLTALNQLQDNNLGTFTDFRVNGSGNGGWLMFDFKPGGSATLNRVEVIPRQDQYFTRINGTVVQGSNDNATWQTISNAATSSADWQTLRINSPQPYRYLRMYNGGAWFGNMAELKLYGAVESTNQIATASIASSEALRNRVVAGNTVTLTFTAKEAISSVNATIQGAAATVTTTDNLRFTATATLPQGAAPGPVTFAVDYRTASGKPGYRNTATTDGTSLYVADESDVLRNLPAMATLIDSTVNRTAAVTLSQVNALFDANLATASDFRIGSNNTGTGSFITFDFKAGNRAALTSVEVAARQDANFGRVRGVVIQGSSDNANWSTLTPAAASTMDWQTLPVSGGAYRYIRIWNAANWFGNLAEVRFHGAVQGRPVDVSANVKFTQTAATLNRATGKYVGSITITNTGATPLAGPLQLALRSLAAGITLDNASGSDGGVPYVTVAAPLQPGGSTTIPLTFTNPSRAVVAYSATAYQGAF